MTLYLPADVVEASERFHDRPPSKRSETIRRQRASAIEQVLHETWLALNARYYQPREAIAALLQKGDPSCSS